jgi:hypothetical protein
MWLSSYDEGVITVQAVKQQARFLLLPACLAAVVLGILGMHAFTHHQPMPMTAAASATTQPAAGAQATGHDLQTVTGVVPELSERAATAPAGHPVPLVSALPDPMSDMVMLCAAMLLGAAAGALLALRLARLARTRGLPHTAVGGNLTNPFLPRVGTGPPDVWRFSVVRC